MLALLVSSSLTPAFANPEGGVVSAGQATIGTAGSRTTINQSSDRAIIDWRGFDIAAGEETRFNQPSAHAVTLNRVNSMNPSHIDGTLSANGNIILINPNGVMFGQGAVVDVNGLVATSADIGNDDFMAGNMHFNRPGHPDARIVNDGTITAHDAGLIGLVAPQVENNGVIAVKAGRAQLSSADTVTVDLYGDGLMEIAVSDDVRQQAVINRGRIRADGGTIAMTAAAGRQVVDSLIQVDGELIAPVVAKRGGKITIGAAKTGASRVNVTGRISADAQEAGGTGGSVTITGDHIAVSSAARLSATGAAGGGTVRVGGDAHGAGPTATARTTTVTQGAVIDVSATEKGDGGTAIVWADETTAMDGTVHARGGVQGGDGGFIETSGKKILSVGHNAQIDLAAPRGRGGTWLLDPEDITISDSGDDGDANTSDVASSTINGTLDGGGDVVITTNAVGPGNGDIRMTNATIDKSVANHDATLRLEAARNIVISGSSIDSSSGDALSLVLNADTDQGTDPGGAISISNTNIYTRGGDITMGGGADPTTGFALASEDGVFDSGIAIANSHLYADGGDVIMNGKGESTGNDNYGVYIKDQYSGPHTNGNGRITIYGIGGAGVSSNYGIYATSNSGEIVTVDGLIKLTAQGGGDGTGSSNFGLFVADGFDVRATGKGGISIYAYGGQGTSGNIAHYGNNASSVFEVNEGDLIAEYTGGAGSNNDAYKQVYMRSVGADAATAGNIDLTVYAGLFNMNYCAMSTNAGDLTITTPSTIATNNGKFTSTSGTVTLRANALSIANGPTTQIGSTNGDVNIYINSYSSGTVFNMFAGGTLRIANRDAGFTLSLGSTAANIQLQDNRLAKISAANFIFGSDTAGAVSINTAHDFAATNLSVLSGSDIAVGSDYISTGNGTLSLAAVRNISTTAALTTQGGAIALRADSDGNAGGAVSIAGDINSGGADITVGGGSGMIGAGSGFAKGNSLQTAGVTVGGGATVDAAGGDIIINGAGADLAADNNNGVVVDNGTVTTAGSGTVTITGTGGGITDSGGDRGIYITNGGAVGTAGGALALTGTGGGAGSGTASHGIAMDGGSVATGSGMLTLIGVAAHGTDLFASGGAVGNGGMDGAIVINADTVALSGWSLQTAGALTVRPRTAGAAMDIGTGTGVLQLTDAVLGQLLAGSYSFGGATAGTVTIDSGYDFGGADVAIRGDDMILNGGLADSGGILRLTADQGGIAYNAGTLTAGSLYLDAQTMMTARINAASAADIGNSAARATLTGQVAGLSTQAGADRITGGPGNNPAYRFNGFTIRYSAPPTAALPSTVESASQNGVGNLPPFAGEAGAPASMTADEVLALNDGDSAGTETEGRAADDGTHVRNREAQGLTLFNGLITIHPALVRLFGLGHSEI